MASESDTRPSQRAMSMKTGEKIQSTECSARLGTMDCSAGGSHELQPAPRAQHHRQTHGRQPWVGILGAHSLLLTVMGSAQEGQEGREGGKGTKRKK